jgi:hypothetical protein
MTGTMAHHFTAYDGIWLQGEKIMIEIRKVITTRETVFSELGVEQADRRRGPWEWRSSATRSPVSSSRI